LLSHLLFLQRPFRWLQAVSRYGATTSGAPDFAFDLCTRKIKPEQRELLDLRSWEVAFNGAEPVQYKTIVEFSEYFAPCGFRQEAFFPCYGLAESTLLVTGGPKLRPMVKQHFSKAGLAENKVIQSAEEGTNTKTLVSCGQCPPDQTLQIVDSQTGGPCGPDKIGEIWVRSDSVAHGYWNNPSDTETYFSARLPTTEEGPFLRTGDLGFLKDGELYLTGRLKNLLISEGKNHYPHDLERTVESAHPAILPTGSAVFSLDEIPERIVVVAEVRHDQNVKVGEVIRAVRSALSDSHGLHVDEIRLTGPGGVPKTTSGKKKHFLCREHYLTGTLKEIH
jgi:acyl-CoA synthetase (AMP-forming)/AMP-acid ligase II